MTSKVTLCLFFKQKAFEKLGKMSPAMGPTARKDPFERSMEKFIHCFEMHKFSLIYLIFP